MMSERRAALEGPARVLLRMSWELRTTPWKVERHGEGYRLVADKLDDLPDVHAAREEAGRILAAINHAAVLDGWGREAGAPFALVRPGALVRVDATGRETTVLHTVGRTVSMPYEILSHEPSPFEEDTRLLYELADDENVARAFRVHSAGFHEWFDLAWVLEVVEGDLGEAKRGRPRGQTAKERQDQRKQCRDAGRAEVGKWCDGFGLGEGAPRAFRGTANSPAAGELARHGYPTTDPPQKPMTLKEARRMVRLILREWLREKQRQRQRRP